MKKKVKIAFSGSGTVFYAHFGALLKLNECFNIIEVVTTSGPSIPVSLYAVGYSPVRIQDILENLDLAKMADYSFMPLINWGLINGEALYKELKRFIPFKFNQTLVPISMIVSNVSKGRSDIYSSELTPSTFIAEIVRATISIPFLFKYIKINGDICIDGGVMNNFAIDLFKPSDEYEVIGVKIKHTTPKKQANEWKDYPMIVTDLLIAAHEQKHIEDATHAKICYLDVPNDSLSFKHTKTDIRNMIYLGYSQMTDWLKKKQLI